MWDFDTCNLCHGSGKLQNENCPVCQGIGLWEFVSEDNHLAVLTLLNMEYHVENSRAKEICNRRLQQVTPDNIEGTLASLEKSTTEADFNALHASGAKNWGWAWVHANRFAIELARLCGSDPTAHRYGLTRLAFNWLFEENQKKVDAPIDKFNPSVL